MAANTLAEIETPLAVPVYVGRQAIYDRDLNVVAYELLYRDSAQNCASFDDGDRATGELLLNTFVEIGVDEIAGDLPVFVNVSPRFIVEGHCRQLPRDRVVIEALEDMRPSDEIVAALADLRKQGYRIALDDFVYDDSFAEIVPLSEIVKLDVLELGREKLVDQVAALQQFNVQLLAEKVETYVEFDFCRELGFTLFQGYFESRPRIVSGQRIPSDRLTTLQLISELSNPLVELSEIEQLVSRDATLSYKLLKFVNSSHCGLRRSVDSIRHAAAMVGLSKLKTWACFLAMGQLNQGPAELLAKANIRAKMCELLAREQGVDATDRFFTVGLLSVLDALIGQNMADVLEHLPLQDDLRDALLHRQGELGQTLRVAIAYKQGDWSAVSELGIPPHKVRAAYFEAVHWSRELLEALKVD